MHKHFALFGTSDYSVVVASELLEKHNIKPALIVTVPDALKGRDQTLSKSSLKVWAEKNNIPVFQPATLKKDQIGYEEIINKLSGFDVFLVASYGKIIPQYILDLPKQGALNLHPSLLPKFRGPSPIQYQILANEEQIGSTLMFMDAEVDHGNIVAQEILSIEEYRDTNNLPRSFKELEHALGIQSAQLAATVLLEHQKDTISSTPQDHTKATFTKMVQKQDALINMDPAHTADEKIQIANFLTYQAYIEWPRAFFMHNNKRVVVTKAKYDAEKKLFVPITVIPEGKKEMPYADYMRGHSL